MTSSASEFEGSPLVITGTGSPTVLLLAGGSESPNSYFPGLTGLPVTTVAWDRPGTGGSPDTGTEGVRLAAASAALHRLVTSLGVGPVIVLGHSLGGALAVQLLIDHPDDVAGVIALDPTPVNSPATLKTAKTGASALGTATKLPGGGRAVAALMRAATRKQVTDLTPEARAAHERMTAVDPAQLARSVAHLVADGAALASRLGKAGVPVVIVTAGNRKPTSPVYQAHGELARLLGGRLEGWSGTDHIVHLQRPAKVRDLLEGMLSQGA